MPETKNRKLTREEQAVADCLRFYRMRQRFTQQEIADLVGATRATISNIEYGTAKVSFAVGYEFCRRLELSMRWLATGQPPESPFISPDELGIPAAEVRKLKRRGVDFLSGYRSTFEKPLADWYLQAPPDEVITRIVRRTPQAVARTMSEEKLLEIIPQLATNLTQTDDMPHRHDLVVMALAMLNELRERLEAAHPETLAREPKPSA